MQAEGEDEANTFSRAKMMDTIFIEALDLTKHELSQQQCISMKVPGFGLGGGRVTD